MSRPASLIEARSEPAYAIAAGGESDPAVEDWLREAAREGDLRAALTLVSHGRPALRAEFELWRAQGGALGVYGLCGLARLGLPVAEALAEAARHTSGWPARVASETLTRWATIADGALWTQLRHPAVAVRSAALAALLDAVGAPPPWREPRQAPFQTLALRLTVELQCVYPEAADAIETLLRGFATGTPPDTLLPPYVASPEGALAAFGEGMPHGRPWTVRGFAELGPHDQEWVVAVALLRVGLLDAFAAEALGALGRVGSLPALREVHARLVGTDPRKAGRFARVIERLEGA
jgi:hypothetical protein